MHAGQTHPISSPTRDTGRPSKFLQFAAATALACASANAGISTVALHGQAIEFAGLQATLDFGSFAPLRVSISDQGHVAFRQQIDLGPTGLAADATVNAVWSTATSLTVLSEQTTGFGFPLEPGERSTAGEPPLGGSFKRGSSSFYYRGVMLRADGERNAAMFNATPTGPVRLQTFAPHQPGISPTAAPLQNTSPPIVATDGSFITVGTETDGTQRLYRWVTDSGATGMVDLEFGAGSTVGATEITGIGSDAGFNASLGYADSGEVVLVATSQSVASPVPIPRIVSIDASGNATTLAADGTQLTLADGSTVTAYLNGSGHRPIDVSRGGTVGILSAVNPDARADLLIRTPGDGFRRLGQLRSITGDPNIQPGDLVRSQTQFAGINGQLTASDAGTLAGVAAEVQQGDTPIDVVWTANADDGIVVLARDGHAAPGLGDGGIFDLNSAFAQLTFNLTTNELGHVAFTTRFTGDGRGTGLWAQDLDGTLVLAARTGQQIEYEPGMFAAITDLSITTDADLLTPFSERVFNTNGQIVFEATLDNGLRGVFVATIPTSPTALPLAAIILFISNRSARRETREHRTASGRTEIVHRPYARDT